MGLYDLHDWHDDPWTNILEDVILSKITVYLINTI